MTVPLTTLAQGSDSGIVSSRRAIVRDVASWCALWADHAGPDSVTPDIDFATRMAAAAFAGERASPGYAIEIADARTDAGTLTLTVREHRPAPGMVAAQILVSPFHIVTLPRVAGEVRFAESEGSGPDPVTATPVSTPGPASAAAVSASTPSSTGLEPNFAAGLAYLAGPFSGILILLVERANPFVRFHAWQSVLGLGGLGLLAVGTLCFSFLTLLLSPLAFTVMYRLSEIVALVWVVAWVWCLVKAFTGHAWKMPVAGRHAERLATRPVPAG